MIKHYTYQLAVLIPLGVIMVVYGLIAGELGLALAGVAATIGGTLGYLHGRGDD